MQSSSLPVVGLVVAAHAPLAGALVATARNILGSGTELRLEQVEIKAADAPASSFAAVEAAIARADQGSGVLVLADLFGGSAANIALTQLGEDRVEVVTGANLAMVMEAATGAERGKTLTQLAQSVAEAARASVVVAGALISPPSVEQRPAA